MKAFSAAALVLAGLLVASEASAASDIFIQLDGIDGESMVSGHQKEIQAVHFSETWRAGTAVTGGERTVPKPTVGPLVFTKEHGPASVELLGRLLENLRIPKGTVTFVHTGEDGKPATTYTITLTDVYVSAISEKTVEGGRLVDEIQLTFAKAIWESGSASAKYSPTPNKVLSQSNQNSQ